jgi:hypothetical protein
MYGYLLFVGVYYYFLWLFYVRLPKGLPPPKPPPYSGGLPPPRHPPVGGLPTSRPPRKFRTFPARPGNIKLNPGKGSVIGHVHRSGRGLNDNVSLGFSTRTIAPSTGPPGGEMGRNLAVSFQAPLSGGDRGEQRQAASSSRRSNSRTRDEEPCSND